MFTVIYSFHVKKNQEKSFVKEWTELTEIIYGHAGSLGSRLHKYDEHQFVAYALWPDEHTFNIATEILPQSAKETGKRMKALCISIKTEFKSELVCDLIRQQPFQNK